MGTCKNSTGRSMALALAYKTVLTLGYNQMALVKSYGMTYPTLKRIRSGKTGKPSQDWYFLKVSVCLIKKEYERRMCEEEGRDSRMLLLVMMNILVYVLADA